jgi:hypothetical protein
LEVLTWDIEDGEGAAGDGDGVVGVPESLAGRGGVWSWARP